MRAFRFLPLIPLLLLQAGCSKDAPPSAAIPATADLEGRLQALQQCGVYLKEGKGVEDLLKSADRSAYETQSYVPLLSALGGQGSKAPLAINLWWLDLQSLEAPDTYVKILKQMVALTGEELNVSKQSARLDYPREAGQLRFSMAGKLHLVGLTIKGNLLDEAAIVQIARIIESQIPLRRFVVYTLPDNKRLIGCVTPRDMTWLDRETRLDFILLTG
jgi:hypothetical protein